MSHREDVHVDESTQRAILLQTDVTRRKAAILKKLSNEATTGLNSQVICDIERSVARSKGKTVKTITVKLNVPRNCGNFATKNRFFVEHGAHNLAYANLGDTK